MNVVVVVPPKTMRKAGKSAKVEALPPRRIAKTISADPPTVPMRVPRSMPLSAVPAAVLAVRCASASLTKVAIVYEAVFAVSGFPLVLMQWSMYLLSQGICNASFRPQGM